MMIAIKQYGEIKGGRLVLDTPDNYKKLIPILEGKHVRLEVKEVTASKAPRSLRQNNYIWGVVYKVLADHTGHSQQEIHALMSDMFLKEVLLVMNQTVVVTKSTTKLKKGEFNEYIDRIKQWAAMYLSADGRPFVIPEPEKELGL